MVVADRPSPLWPRARAPPTSGRLGIAPPLLFADRHSLVRGWIDGVTLNIAKPHPDPAYFRSAKRACARLHRAMTPQRPRQRAELAASRRRARRAHRLPARHPLSQPQAAVPRDRVRRPASPAQAQAPLRAGEPDRRRTARARRKSWSTRIWMATGKRVYHWITRGMLILADREGGGLRLMSDAPAVSAWLKTAPRRARRSDCRLSRTRAAPGLYAFIEAGASDESLVRDPSTTVAPARKPERLQVATQLPRDQAGRAHRNPPAHRDEPDRPHRPPDCDRGGERSSRASSRTGVICATAMRCERGLA